MTIKQLAELAGVDEATVGRVERGVTKSPSSADAMQKVLSIGIYEQPERPTTNRDPRLSEATVGDLLAALAARYYNTDAGDPARWRPESRDGTSGLVTPRYDASEYEDAQEADRANRPGDVG